MAQATDGDACISHGRIDTRPIEQVTATDLDGYTRCHFFAGVGVWDLALNLAGWPDGWPIWTASCPCQPFSSAGRRAGTSDSRHLWPWLIRLIRERRPVVVIGEQVSSEDGLAWLDIVRGDLESAGYACGAQDTCAAGVGAPHIRQRLYWCALLDDGSAYLRGARSQKRSGTPGDARSEREALERSCGFGGLADHAAERLSERDGKLGDRGEIRGQVEGSERLGYVGRLGDAKRSERWPNQWQQGRHREETEWNQGSDWLGKSGAPRNFWAGSDWVLTRPQRLGDPPGLRPVRPGPLPMDDGTAGGVGRGSHPGFPLAQGEEARRLRLEGYGDAIVAQQAAIFVECVMEEILERLS